MASLLSRCPGPSTFWFVGLLALIVYAITSVVRTRTKIETDGLVRPNSNKGGIGQFIAEPRNASSAIERRKNVLIFSPSVNVEMPLMVVNLKHRFRIDLERDGQYGITASPSWFEGCCLTSMANYGTRIVIVRIRKILRYFCCWSDVIDPGKPPSGRRRTAVPPQHIHIEFDRCSGFRVGAYNKRGDSASIHGGAFDLFRINCLPTYYFRLIDGNKVNANSGRSNDESENILCGARLPKTPQQSDHHLSALILRVLGCIVALVAIMLLGFESSWALLGIILFIAFVALIGLAFNLLLLRKLARDGHSFFVKSCTSTATSAAPTN